MRMRLETPTEATDGDGGVLHQQPTGGQQATAKVDVGIKVQKEGGSINSSSPKTEDSADSSREEDAVKSAKAEMGEVRKENQRLKQLLQQIEKDYKSLQLRFFDILQNGPPIPKPPPFNNQTHDHQEPADHLVSLSLGRSASSACINPPENNPAHKMKEMMKKTIKDDDEEDEELKASLTLGLDSKFQLSSTTETVPHQMVMISPENCSTEDHQAAGKEEDEATTGAETWPPSKMQKLANRNINGDDDQEAGQQQGQVKRARVSVRARCDAPTMNDGCQWRKYGQKIAKGNPCPRAYYRCTVASGCPVRKQVQRCSDDMSILITTYEGSHNHQLPVSATAMASTTSAAASMLLSGSSTSRSGLPTTTDGINMSFYDTSRTKPFYLPSTSPSPLFPTITLDLTSSPSTSSSPSYFNRFPSAATNFTRSYPSTSSLSFASSDSSSINLPTFWGTPVLPYNLGKVPQENAFQSFLEKNKLHGSVSQQSLTETLTKSIASDPSFRSVIAAAISSMVGKNGEQSATESSLVQNMVEKLTSQNQSSAQNGKGSSCGFINGFASSSSSTAAGGGSQLAAPAGLVHSQPPFSIFNSATSTPNSNKQERKNT